MKRPELRMRPKANKKTEANVKEDASLRPEAENQAKQEASSSSGVVAPQAIGMGIVKTNYNKAKLKKEGVKDETVEGIEKKSLAKSLIAKPKKKNHENTEAVARHMQTTWISDSAASSEPQHLRLNWEWTKNSETIAKLFRR